MKTLAYTADASGPVLLHVGVSAGAVRVNVEDREFAEVTVTADADITDRARFTGGYQFLKVEMPKAPPQHVGGITQIAGVNVGMVVGVVYGDLVMHTDGIVVGGFGGAGPIVDIRLPLHSSLYAETVSAPVSATGPLLTAYVQTTSGAIDLDTVAGPSLQSVSGRIRIANLLGIGSIKTICGDIAVTADDPSELNAHTISGDIRVRGPIRLHAHTVSGRVHTN
ncbi:DUF4097 family beta strand repeat-containing protein [Dactylosporangium sp. NPDC051541]|uniref:DUF4097 family beta strand repeat-containing protein n=1 Tax=Dactylosporangium sp. NPDC051541 TaxID=3363977 RepID=UPI0037A26130